MSENNNMNTKIIKCNHTPNSFTLKLATIENEKIGWIENIDFSADHPYPKPFFQLISRVFNYFEENAIKRILQTVNKDDYHLILKNRTTWSIIFDFENLYIISCNISDLKKNFEIALLYPLD